MAISVDESVASLRLLVHMAKADGVLRAEERETLQAALEDAGPLPKGLTVQSLLDERMALDDVFAAIQGEEARLQAYASAYAMAHADLERAHEESSLLAEVRRSLDIDDDQHRRIEALFREHDDETVSSKPSQPFEALEREAKVQAETRKTAIVSAVLGAFPVPGLAIATDLAVVGLQVGLVKDIGRFWGKELDNKTAKGILAAFGLGTGARIAVSNLLKVFPGWGAAFGAATAYASSKAVGQVVDDYFRRGEGVNVRDLKAEFEQAKAQAKQAYEADKAAIDREGDQHREQLAALNAALTRGEITQAQFEARAAALGT